MKSSLLKHQILHQMCRGFHVVVLLKNTTWKF